MRKLFQTIESAPVNYVYSERCLRQSKWHSQKDSALHYVSQTQATATSSGLALDVGEVLGCEAVQALEDCYCHLESYFLVYCKLCKPLRIDVMYSDRQVPLMRHSAALRQPAGVEADRPPCRTTDCCRNRYETM